MNTFLFAFPHSEEKDYNFHLLAKWLIKKNISYIAYDCRK